jgi:hypothetical protein
VCQAPARGPVAEGEAGGELPAAERLPFHVKQPPPPEGLRRVCANCDRAVFFNGRCDWHLFERPPATVMRWARSRWSGSGVCSSRTALQRAFGAGAD